MRTPWDKFRTHRRGWISLWILGAIALVAACANLVCNSRPLMVSYQGQWFFPAVTYYPETAFGGSFDLEPDYASDDFRQNLDRSGGWAVWPPIRFSPDSLDASLTSPPPSSPQWPHLLGTDDQGRDVLARLIYGIRTSLFFALALAFLAGSLGLLAGSIQGYFGGWVDIIFQRILEIWGGLPMLFVLMILSSFLSPKPWVLLLIMVFFGWTRLVGVVRAEFLRTRNDTYVKAAQILGVPPLTVMRRHVLPNAMASALSMIPSLINSGIYTLAALDFLGLGLPPGTPSLGELLQQAKSNVFAPWLGLTVFAAIAAILIPVNFVGEALRDAFDPRAP